MKQDDLLLEKIKVMKQVEKWESKPALTSKGTYDKTRSRKLFNLKNDLVQIDIYRQHLLKEEQSK